MIVNARTDEFKKSGVRLALWSFAPKPFCADSSFYPAVHYGADFQMKRL
jgi:hypothetical protein